MPPAKPDPRGQCSDSSDAPCGYFRSASKHLAPRGRIPPGEIGFAGSGPPETNGMAVAEDQGVDSLDDFVLRCRDAGGVAVDSLDAGATLLVETRNSRYRFVVVDGPKRRVIVQGGEKFLRATPVRLEGATAGGSALKSGWILVGLQFQVSQGRRRIRSSRVRSVTVGAGHTTAPEPCA